MPKKWMCPECRELCATERWCSYCGETLCWELKPEDAAWLDRMPGSDKGENMNPDETGVSSKPTEKGNKMLWDKLDIEPPRTSQNCGCSEFLDVSPAI